MRTDQLYRPIFAQAWSITKKFKAIWFLGFFAALVTSGEFEVLFRTLSDPELENSFLNSIWVGFATGWQEGLAISGNAWTGIYAGLSSHPLNILASLLMLLLVIAFAIFILWLSVVSQAGLINSINTLSRNRKTSLNQALVQGNKYFWPVLAVDITLKVILGLAVYILGKELLLLADLELAGRIVYYLSFILFVFLAVIVAFLVRFQILYIVLKKKPIFQAMDQAWELFKRNWLVSLEMAFLLFIIYFLTFVTVTLLTTILTATTIVVLPFYIGIPYYLKLIIAGLTFFLAVALVVFSTAILSVFQWSCWTILFNKISSNDGIAKIIRTYQKFTDRLASK